MTMKDYEVKGGGYGVVDNGVRGSVEGMQGGCEEGNGSNVSRQIARQSLSYDTPISFGICNFSGLHNCHIRPSTCCSADAASAVNLFPLVGEEC